MKYLVVFLYCVLHTAFVWADIHDDVLHVIRREDGLMGDNVSRIITDHSGRVWISTNQGVNMFNGKKMVSYSTYVGRSKFNGVGAICETSDRSIYAISIDGIIVLKYGSKKFQQVLKDIVGPGCLFADGHLLYIGGREGLFVYDGKHLKRITNNASRMSLDNSVRQILKDKKGKLWFLTKFAVNIYDPRTSKIRTIFIKNGLPDRTSFGQFAIYGGRIYLGTKNNGLFIYDIQSKKLEHANGIGNIISSIYDCQDGKICIATDGSGAYLYDMRKDRIIQTFSTQDVGACKLPTDAIYYYAKDSNGVNWFGLSRYGMAYSYHSEPFFKPFAYGSFTTDGMDVRSFLNHGTEHLIGTLRGFYYIDERRKVVKYFSPEQLGDAHIVIRMIYYQGLYYIATFDGGLKVLDPVNLHLKPQRLSPLLNAKTISSLEVSPHGDLWIGSTEGLFVLAKDGKVRRYTEQNSHIIGGTINSILFDRKNNGWQTGADGISFFLSSSQDFANSHFPKGFFHHEARLMGKYGHEGMLFFYNRENIFYTDALMSKFGKLSMPPGLADEQIYDFLDDQKGHYWVAMDKGLFRMDYSMRNVLHFSFGEGLRGNLIYGMEMDPKGRLWLATSDGLVVVQPSDLERWTRKAKYKVLLYDIMKNGTPLLNREEMVANEEGKLYVTWNIVSQELRMTPILEDYAKPYGRIYEYSTDHGDHWEMMEDGKAIIMKHLFLGKHQLNIRLLGAPGTEKTYSVFVVPSLLFILEMILMIATAVLWFLWHRYHRNTKVLLTERNDIEEALIEVEQAQQKQETPKYQRVKLDERECAEIVARMKKYIETEKVYTNPELKMSDLAETLHLSSSKLSQIFSLYLKENYYEFINRYRLDEFKLLLDQGAYKKYTITALSERCGFKKSSFYSTFRKVEGMTPAEYLKKRNISV